MAPYLYQRLGSMENLPEKPVLNEKSEETPIKARSPHFLHRWFENWRASTAARKEQQVEDLRAQVHEHRADWVRVVAKWAHAVDSAHRRQAAWAKGTDVAGWERDRPFCFSLEHRYAVQAKGKVFGAPPSVPFVLDFRTHEGREVAVAWFEQQLEQQQAAQKWWDARWDEWEETYQVWRTEGCCLKRERARKKLLFKARFLDPKLHISFEKLGN